MRLLYSFSPHRFPSVIVSRSRSSVLGALLLAALLGLPGVLQAQETTAAIRGKVVDAAGVSVPNAQVEVLDQRTGIIRTFTTAERGVFLATRLPPSPRVRDFANRVVGYYYRIGRYMTFNDARPPFPFADFPEPPEGDGWDASVRQSENLGIARRPRDLDL